MSSGRKRPALSGYSERESGVALPHKQRIGPPSRETRAGTVVFQSFWFAQLVKDGGAARNRPGAEGFGNLPRLPPASEQQNGDGSGGCVRLLSFSLSLLPLRALSRCFLARVLAQDGGATSNRERDRGKREKEPRRNRVKGRRGPRSRAAGSGGGFRRSPDFTRIGAAKRADNGSGSFRRDLKVTKHPHPWMGVFCNL